MRLSVLSLPLLITILSRIDTTGGFGVHKRNWAIKTVLQPHSNPNAAHHTRWNQSFKRISTRGSSTQLQMGGSTGPTKTSGIKALGLLSIAGAIFIGIAVPISGATLPLPALPTTQTTEVLVAKPAKGSVGKEPQVSAKSVERKAEKEEAIAAKKEKEVQFDLKKAQREEALTALKVGRAKIAKAEADNDKLKAVGEETKAILLEEKIAKEEVKLEKDEKNAKNEVRDEDKLAKMIEEEEAAGDLAAEKSAAVGKANAKRAVADKALSAAQKSEKVAAERVVVDKIKAEEFAAEKIAAMNAKKAIEGKVSAQEAAADEKAAKQAAAATAAKQLAQKSTAVEKEEASAEKDALKDELSKLKSEKNAVK